MRDSLIETSLPQQSISLPASQNLNKKNLLQVGLGAVLISFAPIFTNLSQTSPSTVGFYRTLIAGITLLLLAKLRNKPLRSLGGKTYLLAGLCGVFFAMDLWSWHHSIFYVGPGLATLLGNFQVFLLALIGVTFLRENFRWRLLAAIALALVGLLFLIGWQWKSVPHRYHLGVYFGLFTACWYACYTLTLRQAQLGEKPVPPAVLLGVICLFCALFSGVIASLQHENLFTLQATSWFWLVCCALICQVAGWLLIATGLPKIPLSIAGFLLLLQPSLAFLWDILLFHRATSFAEIIGVAVTLIAIYLST